MVQSDRVWIDCKKTTAASEVQMSVEAFAVLIC